MANEKLINLGLLTEYDKKIKEHIKNEISTLYDYKGSVDNFSDLPINPEKGDVWNVVNDNGTNYAWDGEKWDSLGSSVDLSGYVEKKDHVSLIKQEASHSFKQGDATSAGTHCYYWDAIDFDNKLIHIVDGWQPGTGNHPFPVISNDFESDNISAGTGPSFENQDITGYEFSITNGDHFYRFGRVTSWDGIEILEFEFINGSEFDSIVTYDNLENIHGLSYSLVFNDHPELGDHLVGTSARAYGQETKSYASNSTAIGKYTEAYGNGSIATGKETKAIGNYSASFGFDTQAHGHHAFSSGKVTRALGNSSFASGSNTVAIGNYSFTTGYATEAGETAFASGYQSKALAPYSFVSGFQTTVELDENSIIGSRGASAIGAGTISRGYGAHAQGIETQAIAQGAFAAGRGSIAAGKYSTAIGDGAKTRETATGAFAIGTGTTVNGSNAFAGGKGSTAYVEGFAFGHNASARDYALAVGYNANAAKFGTAIGRNCKVTGNYQVAVGVNNDFDENMLFMIGNGIDEYGNLTSRKNAFTVYKNGEAQIGTLHITEDTQDEDKLGASDVSTIKGLCRFASSDVDSIKLLSTDKTASIKLDNNGILLANKINYESEIGIGITDKIKITGEIEGTGNVVLTTRRSYYEDDCDSIILKAFAPEGDVYTCLMGSYDGKWHFGSDLTKEDASHDNSYGIACFHGSIGVQGDIKIGKTHLSEETLKKLIKLIENNPVLATDTAITKDNDGTIVLA